jgi:hypothetical protein
LKQAHRGVRARGNRGCIAVEVYVKEDGTFAVAITHELTGTVTLTIVASALTDSFGTTFPSVDTDIGTVTVPAGSVAPSGSALLSQVRILPESTKRTRLVRVAQPAITQTVQQPRSIHGIPAVLGLLLIVGAVMIMMPNKSKEYNT